MTLTLMLLMTLFLTQDPYQRAPDNFRLEFENAWTRVSRVTFRPGDKIPEHDHPAFPTVYVYLTDAGPARFSHVTPKFSVERAPVKAGAVRFNRGSKETHEVEYLGSTVSEYLRIELRTPPLDLPRRDVRWTPEESGPFENGQIRMRRVSCAPADRCIEDYPAVAISIDENKVRWVEPGQRLEGKLTLIEFKTN